MRVDPFYVSNLVSALDQTQLTQQQLTSELSSGVRVTQLSQDPVAAGQNVLLLNQIQSDDTFTQTSDLVQGQLQVADSALGDVATQLTNAISLATSASNGTLNASQLQDIATQLAGIRDQVVALANTSYQGQYIFGGSLTTSAPFSTSTATSPATTSYNGDENINYLETPNGQTIQLNIPGDQIFTTSGSNSAFAALNSLIDNLSSGGDTTTTVSDLESLNTAMNYISQQRVALDNSLSRLTSATDAVSAEQVQLTAAQTTLMQADLAGVATQLSLSQTQQTALEDVIAQFGSGSLFDKL